VADSEGWLPVEDSRIAEAVVTYAGEGAGGGVEWTKVAAHVNTTKTAKQCHKRWHRVLKMQPAHSNRVRTDHWDAEEDNALNSGIQQWRSAHVFQSELMTANDTTSELNVGFVENLHMEMARVDWQRISLEALKGRRTPRQCENRFEGLEMARHHHSGDDKTSSNCSCGSGSGISQGRPTARHMSISSVSSASSSASLSTATATATAATAKNAVSTSSSSSLDEAKTVISTTLRPTLLPSEDLSIPSHEYRGPAARAAARIGPWTAAEDECLTEAVLRYDGHGRGGAIDWGRVCEHMGGHRTYDQCRMRWNGVLKVSGSKGSSVKRGQWSEEEVRRLQ
jgi:hypothetical protein